MVLSNKKLKEKVRAVKAELSSEDPSSQSLKSLLDSAVTHKKSKRVKRRETAAISSQDGPKVQEQGGSSVGVSELKERRKKKRKRDESETKGLKKNEKKSSKKKKKTDYKKKNAKKKHKVQNGDVKDGVNIGDGRNGNEAAVVQPSESVQRVESGGDISNKVYVGGIPYYSTEDDIRSYFESCGTITELDCMNFPDTGKFRGIAIITFKTEAAAKRALALDGSDMGGLFLKIQSYKSARAKVSNFSPNMVEGYNRVYVGNLSWNVTEDDLKKLFSDCSISSIRFGEDKETGEFRGYAHVDFADSVSIKVALKLDQNIVCGRPVRISCAVAKEGAVKRGVSTNSHFNKGVSTNSRPPKDQNATDSVPTSSVPTSDAPTSHAPTSVVPTSDAPTTAVSAKIRRRTCYECGERGHLSSSCPKKQETDKTEQVAT